MVQGTKITISPVLGKTTVKVFEIKIEILNKVISIQNHYR